MRRSLALLVVLVLIANALVFTGCNSEKHGDLGKITFKEFTGDDIEYENDTLFVKSQLLITAPEKYTYSDVEKSVKKYNGNIVGCIEFTNDYQVEFTDADYDKLIEIKDNLSNDLSGSEVTFHEAFEADMSADYKDNYDKDFTSKDGNWWRSAIKLTDLENKNYDYENVKVGVNDSSFDTDNPDLSYAFNREKVWHNDKSRLEIEDYHGTNVCGFLAAKKNNGKGIDGVANNVELSAYSDSGEMDSLHRNTSVMADKYSFAKIISSGAKVINYSEGYNELAVASQHGINKAVDYLEKKSQYFNKFFAHFIDYGYEFVIVKSAMNLNAYDSYVYIECDESKEHPYGIKAYKYDDDGDLSNNKRISNLIYTADYDYLGAIKDEKVRNRIIVVGSSDKDNKRAEHSVCGDRVDIYAPGERLTELTTGELGDGTSYAAPIVSGVVALMWGVNPGIKADDIKFLLKSSATQPIIDEKYRVVTASGDEVYMNKYLVNADNAVERAKSHDSTLVVGLGEDEGMLLGHVNKLNEQGERVKFEEPCEILIAKGTAEDVYKDLTDPDSKDKVVYQTIDTDAWGEFDVSLPEGDYYLYASYNNDELRSSVQTFSIAKGEVKYLNDIILSENLNKYYNKKYGWSVKTTPEWKHYGLIKEEDTKWNGREGYVVFAHKEVYEHDFGPDVAGQVMWIYAISKNNTSYNKTNGWYNQGGFLGENKDYYFFWEAPNDVRVPNMNNSEFERQMSEYRQLYDTRDEILNSFKLDSGKDNNTNNSKVDVTHLDPSKCLNFDISKTGWKDFDKGNKVGFYLAEIGGKEFKPWGSKALFKSEETSSDIWSFDPEASGFPIENGKQYYVIFTDKEYARETHELLFDKTCLGDTAYCTGEKSEYTFDESKNALETRWKNSKLGPMKVITLTGRVVGETIPDSYYANKMLVDFLCDKIEYVEISDILKGVRDYTGRTDQQILDDIAVALNLSKDNVEKDIAEAGVKVNWSKSKSKIKR